MSALSPKKSNKAKMTKFSGHIYKQNNICQKCLCGQDHLWGMSFQTNKQLGPGMVGTGGVVVRIQAV